MAGRNLVGMRFRASRIPSSRMVDGGGRWEVEMERQEKSLKRTEVHHQVRWEVIQPGVQGASFKSS